jgi:hypothetical protein
MKNIPYIAAALISAFTVISASAAESQVLNKAGLALPEVSVPVPQAPRNNQWLTLRKIKVNQAQPDMNDTLVGLIDHSANIDNVVKELNDNGFKAQAVQDNHGGYMVMVDVSGLNAADCAVGLARYYYVNEVQVGQKVYNRLFSVNNDDSRSAKSTFAVKMGTIKGGINGAKADISLNKLAWTITGGLNGSPVDVKIDQDAKTITGGANGSPVDLKFDWSPEQVTVTGGADSSEVNYTVNWKNGLLEGYAGGAPLRMEFDMQEGVADANIVKVTGYAGGADLDLTFNKISGRISGGMGGAPVNMTLVNCDLYDFLQYAFLFVK